MNGMMENIPKKKSRKEENREKDTINFGNMDFLSELESLPSFLLSSAKAKGDNAELEIWQIKNSFKTNKSSIHQDLFKLILMPIQFNLNNYIIKT